jgi:hypothetical protein
MKYKTILITAFLYGLLSSDYILASHISMITSTTVSFEKKGFVSVKLKVDNQGDEDSLSVFPTLKLGNKSIQLKEVPYIAFSGSNLWTHDFAIDETGLNKPGCYPLFVLITYHDANMYQFSTNQIITVNYQNFNNKKILNVALYASGIKSTGHVNFKVTNNTANIVSGSYQLFLPKEISAEKNQQQFSLGPKEEQIFDFLIKNETALVGSRYNIYGIAQFSDTRHHYTFISSTITNIQESSQKTSINKILTGGVLFILFIFLMTIIIEVNRMGKENAIT